MEITQPPRNHARDFTEILARHHPAATPQMLASAAAALDALLAGAAVLPGSSGNLPAGWTTSPEACRLLRRGMRVVLHRHGMDADGPALHRCFEAALALSSPAKQ